MRQAYFLLSVGALKTLIFPIERRPPKSAHTGQMEDLFFVHFGMVQLSTVVFSFPMGNSIF